MHGTRGPPDDPPPILTPLPIPLMCPRFKWGGSQTPPVSSLRPPTPPEGQAGGEKPGFQNPGEGEAAAISCLQV